MQKSTKITNKNMKTFEIQRTNHDNSAKIINYQRRIMTNQRKLITHLWKIIKISENFKRITEKNTKIIE